MNKIYGMYDLKNKEQCVFVGTIFELKKFTKLTGRGINRVLKNGMYQGRYQVIYLYNEDTKTLEEYKEKLKININLNKFLLKTYLGGNKYA